MNLFDLLANDPNLAAGFKRIFQVAAAQMPEGASLGAEDSSTSQHSSGAAAFTGDLTERSVTKPEAVGDDRAELVVDARSDDPKWHLLCEDLENGEAVFLVEPKSIFQKPAPDGTDWDQLAQDDRDTFDARLDAMPEPLGDDE